MDTKKRWLQGKTIIKEVYFLGSYSPKTHEVYKAKEDPETGLLALFGSVNAANLYISYMMDGYNLQFEGYCLVPMRAIGEGKFFEVYKTIFPDVFFYCGDPPFLGRLIRR